MPGARFQSARRGQSNKITQSKEVSGETSEKKGLVFETRRNQTPNTG
jgi:hypothetical protein